ncbi:MAG: polymer-forming cytoskeletal protein [Lachnospiraceae bacterium]|nr:polymer-forming cytoskeletal protein [Lachnospiraceae bacterium]MCR4732363.1 polymer-forming cytoskeletal protein [Lachnospiraceae bacterium]
MGFFKDFKDDFSDALDEMIPAGSGNDSVAPGTDHDVSVLDDDVDVDKELSKLDGLFEQAVQKADEPKKLVIDSEPEVSAIPVDQLKKATPDPVVPTPEPVAQSLNTTSDFTFNTKAKENNKTMADVNTVPMNNIASAPVSDEEAVITAGMTITGDLDSTGAISVEGTINGNVRCNGKLTVTGTVNGNSTSAEFFADQAKIQGEVATSGTVKIGVGSVVVGNISATSAVIAGAVKGDIDVQGPVVVDTSAVVMGNIKSRSVQINNGAVIEGFCSQAYADVDVSAVFGS